MLLLGEAVHRSETTGALLPSPEIIRTTIGKVILAFQDTVQVELIRTRVHEIRKLQNAPKLALAV